MKRFQRIHQLAGNRPLAGLVLANGLSSVGDWLYLTTLPIFVLRETGDIALVGAVAAVRLLPWLVLSLPAGVVADRFPRVRVLLASETSRAALMILMTAACVTRAPLWFVLAFALGAVVAGTFAMPAHLRMIPELARNDAELGLANAISSGLDNLACVVGPAIGALLIVAGGLEFAFLLNGLSFLVVVFVLFTCVRPATTTAAAGEAAAPSSEPEHKVSWAAIARTAARPLTLDAAISFAAGALSVLPVIVVVDQLKADIALAGVINLATGLGGIVGATFAARMIDGNIARAIALGVALVSAGLIATATNSVTFVALVALGACAAGVIALDVINTTNLQRRVPERQLGRTFGLLHSLASLWVMAGCLLPTLIVAQFGVTAALIVPAAVVAILGAASFAGQGWGHATRPRLLQVVRGS